MSSAQIKVNRRSYPSDLKEKECLKLSALLPLSKSNRRVGGRPGVEVREVVNGIGYVVKEWISWPSLPQDLAGYMVILMVGVRRAYGKPSTLCWFIKYDKSRVQGV